MRFSSLYFSIFYYFELNDKRTFICPIFWLGKFLNVSSSAKCSKACKSFFRKVEFWNVHIVKKVWCLKFVMNSFRFVGCKFSRDFFYIAVKVRKHCRMGVMTCCKVKHQLKFSLIVVLIQISQQITFIIE